MILINLLPHREAARRRQKKVFDAWLLASLMTGLTLAGMGYGWLQMQVSKQQQRNEFLQSEIASLNQQIKEIEGLEGEIAALQAKQKAVEDLQANRNAPVHLLNALVHQLPEGVYLRSLKQTGPHVAMSGVAQSNERVSQVLRNLSGHSPWVKQPELKEIVASTVALGPKEQRKVVNFSISFILALPEHAVGSAQPNGGRNE